MVVSFVFILTVIWNLVPFYCGSYLYKIQGKELMIKVIMGFCDSGNVTSVIVTVTG